MLIEIWSDFVCPFCYIGKRKLEKAIQKLGDNKGIQVVYKAYELNPNAPLSTTEKGSLAFSKLKNMDINQAKEMFKNISDRALEYGLKYDMEKTLSVKTHKAHRLAKYARTQNKENILTELLMDAHFVKGLNIADDEVLLDFSKKIGLDNTIVSKILKNNEYADVVNQEIKEAHELGVQGVPFFVFNRKFALSGAAPDEHFDLALTKAQEESTIEIIDNTDTLCGPDGCLF